MSSQVLKIPAIHHASDRRCYYGAFCSDMEREIMSKKQASEALATNDIHITYYPAGAFYVGFEGREIITKDCLSFDRCVHSCVEYLKGKGVQIEFS